MLRLLLLSLSVNRQSVSATVTAVSEPSVSAVVSVTAITGLRLRRHFQLRPKPEKLVSVGLLTPPSYNALAGVTPFAFRDEREIFKTRTMGLPYSEETMIRSRA